MNGLLSIAASDAALNKHKIVERVVVKRLTAHVNASNLQFPVHQSAYRAHHRTKTALLSVHNDLVCFTDDGMQGVGACVT